MMNLFEHNRIAYESAVSMLKKTGKATIIHPTGTGKSFIGFQLCSDNIDKRVCWISPSEYIFKTQIENLVESGADVPENIAFFTYAKIAMMQEDEIKAIQPNYIVLDEFHRCGAEIWGLGVQNLLSVFPNAPILGLSATNIRYLDNQRDMADELFDGNIASEMTLGEAIVRGILRAPKYVTALYGYQKDFAQYEKRIHSSRNKAVRAKGEQILEDLRRALEKADGLDVIFEKHITDKTGKYIVFTANKEHMDEMTDHVPEWFSGIDTEPHIYKAYSSDPETSKEFAAFKQDSSEHLKLLFAIDMLNEGVHVDDISGVILFRPTISPIVFKQQIGRALSAGKKKDVVILDIVNNISNLYSIGAIEEEMQAAITYYHYLGENQHIVNEAFRIIDEVQDCRALFDELEGVLTASWSLMYQEVKKYYEENGDLLIPAKYKTIDGLSLGYWLLTQKRIYNGQIEGKLTAEQIQKLESIGMVWERHADLTWEKFYSAAKHYYEQNGDLNVPAKYLSEDGMQLGIWVSRMRQAKADEKATILSADRIKRLEDIGICWNLISFQWEENFSEALAYYKEHGNLLVPGRYVSPKGIKLGQWIVRMRSRKRGMKSKGEPLTTEQIQRLEQIGMVWDVDEENWRIGFEHAKSFYKVHENLKVPATYKTADGFTLGLWIGHRRGMYKAGTLPEDKIKELESIGMLWQVYSDIWMENYNEAKQFFYEHGNLRVPRGYKTAAGRDLGAWVMRCRTNKDKQSAEQVKMLEDIGIEWAVHRQKDIMKRKREL